MGCLFRAIRGLLRTVIVAVLVAVVVLIGLSYFDNSGTAQGKVNQVLADTVGPKVAIAVENTGGKVLSQAGNVLRGLMSKADEALGQGVLAIQTPVPQGARDASSGTTEADSRALLDMINQYRESIGTESLALGPAPGSLRTEPCE